MSEPTGDSLASRGTAPEPEIAESGWTLPTWVELDGRLYRVRSRKSMLQVKVRNTWRSQQLFRVYDPDSLRLAVDIVVRRHERPTPAWVAPLESSLAAALVRGVACALPVDGSPMDGHSAELKTLAELALLCDAMTQRASQGAVEQALGEVAQFLANNAGPLSRRRSRSLLRCAAGCLLLRGSQLPTPDVARRVGCAGADTFARMMRRWVGATPVQVRNARSRASLGHAAAV